MAWACLRLARSVAAYNADSRSSAAYLDVRCIDTIISFRQRKLMLDSNASVAYSTPTDTIIHQSGGYYYEGRGVKGTSAEAWKNAAGNVGAARNPISHLPSLGGRA